MFSQRTSSQKPGDALLANFREQFLELGVGTASTVTAPAPATTVTANPSGIAVTAQESHSLSHDTFHDQDSTPRASNEPWKFTTSIMDSNSFSFANFGNQPPGYYTPTPGGTNTLYHPQAGDLHTPSLALHMGLGTPLSMPTSGNALHSHPGMTTFPQGLHPHQFHSLNPFIQPPQAQTSFAPSTFVHQDTGYETMDQDGSPIDSDPADERMGSIDGTFHGQSSLLGFQQRQYGVPLNLSLPASAEQFRFHATFNAPTAMIKHADEIPVTYLNKGQAYSLSIVDTKPTLPILPGTKFRTFVRVSFEDDQQRQKPGVCWSLWKEGRGTNEAHQRGGKLQAVEFVEAGQPPEGDDKRTRIELERASFDGFSVLWTPGVNGAVECNIAVRFNFLSTDFSHSKGVKGIPVRLCAKTNPVTPDSAQASPNSSTTEVCYCKVKLFRDHGAERKLSNDVAHVKKTIDKLKQQIAQTESGGREVGKRKRSAASQVKVPDQRPGKVPKHKRTWSMSSASSAGGGQMPIEEDLHFKLQNMQDMFTSTRPVSILYLRGEDLDDPDAHPVSLPGDPADVAKMDGAAWQARSARSSIADSTLVSPSPSFMSIPSQPSASGQNQRQGVQGRASSVAASSQQDSDQTTKIDTTDDAGNLSGWIEAFGVDQSYRPPPERTVKPVACFYIICEKPSEPETKEFHRAIYLTQRTLQEFKDQVAAKWSLDPKKIVRTVHVLQRGLEVEMDDDVIHELAEGQDMKLQIHELGAPVKREWDMAIDMPGENETSSMLTARTNGYELRLIF